MALLRGFWTDRGLRLAPVARGGTVGKKRYYHCVMQPSRLYCEAKPNVSILLTLPGLLFRVLFEIDGFNGEVKLQDCFLRG